MSGTDAVRDDDDAASAARDYGQRGGHLWNGQHVAIGFLGIELSELQAERLEALTTNYVGNLAEVLFHTHGADRE
jgi:hypothetical protein